MGGFVKSQWENNVFATLSNLLSPHALRVALLAFPSEQKLGFDKAFFCTHTTHEKLEVSVFWSFDSSSSFFKSSGGNKNTSTMSPHYFSGSSFFFLPFRSSHFSSLKQSNSSINSDLFHPWGSSPRCWKAAQASAAEPSYQFATERRITKTAVPKGT